MKFNRGIQTKVKTKDADTQLGMPDGIGGSSMGNISDGGEHIID